jgi:multiple sugar transport system permease protein
VSALAGSPSVNYVAYTISHHLAEYGSTRWEVGYASAISFVLFLLQIGSNMAVKKLLDQLGGD